MHFLRFEASLRLLLGSTSTADATCFLEIVWKRERVSWCFEPSQSPGIISERERERERENDDDDTLLLEDTDLSTEWHVYKSVHDDRRIKTESERGKANKTHTHFEDFALHEKGTKVPLNSVRLLTMACMQIGISTLLFKNNEKTSWPQKQGVKKQQEDVPITENLPNNNEKTFES